LFFANFFFTDHDRGSLKRKVCENYYRAIRQRYCPWFDMQLCGSSEVNSLLFTLVMYSQGHELYEQSRLKTTHHTIHLNLAVAI